MGKESQKERCTIDYLPQVSPKCDQRGLTNASEKKNPEGGLFDFDGNPIVPHALRRGNQVALIAGVMAHRINCNWYERCCITDN